MGSRPVMRALAEEAGQLDEIGTITLPMGVFTGGMVQLLQRRIQRVTAADQALLQLTAVAGRQLDAAVLRELAPNTNITAWQQRVGDAAVLSVHDNQWQFAHDKLLEALLAELDGEQQRELHRQVAEALETVYPEDSNYHEALLGHWHQAGNLDKELHYLEPVTENLVLFTGEYERARVLLDRGLALLPPGDGRRVALLNRRAASYWHQGQFAKGEAAAQLARTLAQKGKDRAGLAEGFRNLGIVAYYQGDYATARDYHQQSLTISQALGDQRGIAHGFHGLGNVADSQGDYAAARDYYQETLSIDQSIGDQRGIGTSLSNLGWLTDHQGDYAAARDFQQQTLAIFQTLGDQWGIANTLNNLGYVYLHLRPEHARPSLHRVLVIAQDIQTKLLILEAVVGFAWLHMHENRPTRAGELTGLVQQHPVHYVDVQSRLDEVLPQLAEALSSADLEAALERGKALDLDIVVTELLEEFAEDDV